jgi:hypothetical protein
MDTKFEWNLGPDSIQPAKSYTSTRLDEPVKLRIDERKLVINKNSQEYEPISIFTRFKRRVEERPDHVALGNW